MRDKDKNVIVGAIDDIREVVYSVALTKHPAPEQPGLEYPWQVRGTENVVQHECNGN